MNRFMALVAAFAAVRLLRILSYVGMVILSAVALVHWTRAHINPRRPLGLILDWKTITDFGVGTLIGTLAIVGVFFAERLLGLLQTKAVVSSNTHTMWFGLSYLVSVFIEELISNGLMLSGLVLVIRRRWVAVALMAAIFGFLHGMNPNATPLSVFSNALGGAVYAVAYLGSNRLWLGTGIHFAWNFVQGPVLGFPVSGGIMPGSVFSQSVSGPDWLTGGAYGPEGGVIAIGFRFVVAGLVVGWLLYSRRRITRIGSRL
jgi:membrane protease YdiL (CAAX protease family)